MVTLSVGTGRPKFDIIDLAYEECGLAAAEFERTPEEMKAGLRRLNAMMMEAPFSALGYALPAYGDGDLNERSGLLDKYIPAVVGFLALKLAPGLGKSLSAEQRAALSKSMATLRAEIATVPELAMRPGVYLGEGNNTLSPAWST